MILYAKNENGELKFKNNKALSNFLNSNSDYKGEYIIEIEKSNSKRSLNQNDYYWLYLGLIEDETGNLATDLHELFKRKFLPPIPKKIFDIGFKIPSSTTRLTKTEFGFYLDKISAFTGIPLPEIPKAGEMPEYPINNFKENYF